MPITVSTWTDLNNAIQSPPADGVINVATTIPFNGSPGGTITIPAGNTISITGGGTLSAPAQASRHFNVNGSLTLGNITLDGGSTTSAPVGGGIQMPDYNSTYACPASWSNVPSLTLNAGAIIQNCAYGFETGGGAIVAYYGNVTLNPGSALQNNAYTANTNGGGALTLYSPHAIGVMNGGTITGNYSANYGGGINLANGSTFTMNGGVISNNTAASMGGGIFANNMNNAPNSSCDPSVSAVSTFNMKGGQVSGNTAATTEGGGVCLYDSNYPVQMNMTGGSIFNNTAPNIAKGFGGGIAMFKKQSITGLDTNISLNITGVCPSSGLPTTTTGPAIYNNNAGNSGGGIWNNGGQVYLQCMVIQDNIAGIDGGGYYSNAAGTGTATNVVINQNQAGTAGGGIYLSGTATTMNFNSSTLGTNNTAPNGGGAYVAN